MSKFEKEGATVLGISADSVAKLAKFRDKYDLNMPMLSDADKKIIAAYGVYKEKKMYGKTVKGIERTTFLIGKDLVIRKIFPKVKTEGHVEEVLKAVQDL